MPDLSAKAVAALGPGRHRVASHLYLLVGAGRSGTGRSWVMIYVSPTTGKRRDMGLGSFPVISVARAKELVLRHRVAISEGRDPLNERRDQRNDTRERARGLTFREVAEFYVEAHRAGWRSKLHRWQWSATLETYAYPVLGDLPVTAIGTAEVMRVLESVWFDKPETATRLRGRIQAVLDYASARHWRQGDNPARWRGHLANLLPKRQAVRPVEHMAAVPWAELPALWAELADREGVAALALQFNFLTATRTNETIGASWDEIDLAAKVWTIPGARMKAGRPFRVPLTAAALAVLDQLAALRQGDCVFPGAKAGKPLSNMAMLMLLRRLRAGKVTVHGTVRSGFRDWAAEHGISREIAEACLAHVLENKVEAAYRRGDLLTPRRAAMERWARFLSTPSTAVAKTVVLLHGEVPAAG